MKTSTQKRITRFSGLLLLALLVVALNITAAQAMRDFSAGTGGSSTSAVSGTSNAAQHQTGFAWGYYYSPAGRAAIAQRQTGFAWGYYSSGVSTNNARQLHALLQRSPLAQVPRHQGGAASTLAGSGTNTASSGISSTTVWIAAVAVLGTVLIGAWALARRRRRQQREEARACEFSARGLLRHSGSRRWTEAWPSPDGAALRWHRPGRVRCWPLLCRQHGAPSR